MQTPSVGRIVHYVRPISSRKHAAAIITDVLDSVRGYVRIAVLSPGDSVVVLTPYTCAYDARMSPGTWHYPEHVGTVQYHESENEAEKREGPVSNSPEIEEKDYPDPEKNDDEDYEDIV